MRFSRIGANQPVLLPLPRRIELARLRTESAGVLATDWVSIKDAAERLGASADTIRRRRERGELAGRKQPTAQGYVWEIEVPAAEASSDSTEMPAQDLGDLLELELVQLRERVAGLERLSEVRNAWLEQAARSEESNRELRILVQQAQAIARQRGRRSAA